MYGMRICLIGRGRAGWHADTIGEPSEHGPAYTSTGSSSGGRLEDYLREAPEGTPVYDAESADQDSFTDMVIAGPMVNTRLGKGEISRFNAGDKRALAHMMRPGGVSGEFAILGAMALAGLSSLDYVSVDVYLQLLREKVPGIKIGKVVGGAVVWDPPAQAEMFAG